MESIKRIWRYWIWFINSIENISKTIRNVGERSDERLTSFLNKLKERVFRVISEEFNHLIQNLSTYFNSETNTTVNLIEKYPRSCYEVLKRIRNTVLNRNIESEDEEIIPSNQIGTIICSELLDCINAYVIIFYSYHKGMQAQYFKKWKRNTRANRAKTWFKWEFSK